ncbi:hypothetical protein KQI61_15555 [Anaerocolumna aminovalerica]|uniref:hypothetical protein n=1 Tax=Anaerocolumna aminovalerica TaxID=1527 RepID=UPI001C0F1ECD|nr:hypothetical protein [Anaerocolumna aminovalerica]MBU5333615.1 hypothetical protein [Anaerocolumna aminovalerica]
MKQELIEALEINTSLNKDEAEQFINILEGVKDILNIAILDEYWDNWSIFDNYEEAWKDEQTYDDEVTEEQFKQHSFVLTTGRCLVRDYIK